ncbi:MAG: response regulator transcription factor [Thermomicrobium sp.]|nr:response regulator transcription factor [Thermomicrobium sp.]MDW8059898.1 response regulator transcription factor [Thermomicrobium sp.]
MKTETQSTDRKRTPSLVLADPQAAVRQSLRHYLEAHEDLRVVAETGELARLASLIEWQRPDVVLVSAQYGPVLPRFVRAIRRAPAVSPVGDRVLPKVVVYGLGNEHDFVLSLARAGVDALVAAEDGVEVLRTALRSVLRGEQYASGIYSGLLLREVQRWSVLQESQPGVRLTRREVQLLQLVASGLSNKEIAEVLCLAESTVKNRLSLLFDKLGVKDRTQAAIFALANGVLHQPLPEPRPLPDA